MLRPLRMSLEAGQLRDRGLERRRDLRLRSLTLGSNHRDRTRRIAIGASDVGADPLLVQGGADEPARAARASRTRFMPVRWFAEAHHGADMGDRAVEREVGVRRRIDDAA